MSAYILITITTATRDEALRIARTLVEQRLAACGQVSGPITSIYPWQGVIETTEEWCCTLKTRAALFAAVATAIRALHSYVVPQIVSTPLDAISADYQAWLDASLQ
ncbi:MAG: divalent-cation tolerance protein CutA [bacterium]|nr:divalent-cation tolerance protein CutA [bacterium]